MGIYGIVPYLGNADLQILHPYNGIFTPSFIVLESKFAIINFPSFCAISKDFLSLSDEPYIIGINLTRASQIWQYPSAIVLGIFLWYAAWKL